MSEQEQIVKCSRCDHELYGAFCSNCGHPQSVKRISGPYLLEEIGKVLNFDKGILFTIRELLIRPGSSIRKFMLEDRSLLVKPIFFIIVCSLVYVFAQRSLEFEDGYINYTFAKSPTATAMFAWFSKNYGYTNIILSIFIASWLKIFFRKYPYNFFETLILLCFVLGMSMLIFSFLGLIGHLTGLEIIDKGFLVGILYIAWAIGQFFQKSNWFKYLKAFVSYMLGIMSFTIMIMLIGGIVDWIHK